MKTMLILADSLCLVRPEDHILETDLYPYKIQSALPQQLYVISKAKKNNTSAIENADEAYIYHQKATNCHYAVIALGIVDCSPRLFSKTTKKILACMSEIPFIKKVAHGYIKFKSRYRYQLTKQNPLTEVSKIDYENNIKSIIKKLKLHNPIEHIFLINIAYPGKYLIERSYGIEKNIMDYNNVLINIAKEENISIVNVYDFTHKNPKYILDDGHHISSEVHDFIAEKITSFFKHKEQT